MLDACSIDPDLLLVLGRNGVVEADTLDEPSTAPAAAVRDHHVIERPALRARPGESNRDHGFGVLPVASPCQGEGLGTSGQV